MSDPGAAALPRTGSWRDVMPAGAYTAFPPAVAGPVALGRRPVVVAVDVVRAFLGEEELSPAESLARWPLSCGAAGSAALPRIAELLTVARSQDVPVIYTTGDDSALGGATRALVERRTPRADAQQIPSLVAPRNGEVVLPKSRPSAFFGTPLSALLVQLQADCLILCGCTTSGCVRATAVDGYSMGWTVVVAEDGTFDRAQLSHDVSLFELNAKYASVVPVGDLAAALAQRGGSVDTSRAC